MLFDTFSNGTVSLANRIAIAPMTRCRADHRDAVPNNLMVEYYRQRAGAGLIVSEGVPVSDRARGYLNTPALWNEAQAAGWKMITDAVHAAGSVIFAQLWHCGRISHAALHADGSPPAGVSNKRAAGKTFIVHASGQPMLADCDAPRPLTTAEVKAVVRDFANAARLARTAGFDGIEIHGANGYLLDQFRCPFLNDRSDEYGGSLENRYRLLLEVVDATAKIYEPARICVRQSPLGINNDMQADPEPLLTYPWLARELDRRGIGFLHIFDQSFAWIHDPAHPLMPALRAAYGGTIIACGGFLRDNGEAILARGHADLVAIGRPFIANPDLVARFRSGAALAPWEQATFYAGGAKGYTDYPSLAEIRQA
ncbi:MAG TPA: alkene reductase [Rhodocyclaceae bacterium]|nr:alkene reductase [Rhodocyclaceae bacterium]